MVKIGEIGRKEWEKISFRDWTTKGYAHTGRFPLRVIFPPARFPSFTFVFEDEKNRMEVRLSLKAEKVKEVFKALGIELKKADMPMLVVEVEVEEKGLIYGLDITRDTTARLVWKGSYWRREEGTEEDWDDSLKDSF